MDGECGRAEGGRIDGKKMIREQVKSAWKFKRMTGRIMGVQVKSRKGEGYSCDVNNRE